MLKMMKMFTALGRVNDRSHKKTLLLHRTMICSLFLGAAVLATVSLKTETAQAGKPAPPPPPPPPVNYALGLFQMPADYVGGHMDVQEMNNHGEAVGRYNLPDGTQQPFYFDALSVNAVATNLNDMELDSACPVPDGWYIFAALGINDLGDIVGALAKPGAPDTRRGFVLELRPDPSDPNPEPQPRLHLIPDGVWSRTYARRINNAGDVLGVGDAVTAYYYRAALHGGTGDTEVKILPFDCGAWDAFMNNRTDAHGTQVVALWGSNHVYVRYTLENDLLEVLDLPSSVRSVRGLSDAGTFCGHTYVKNKRDPYYYDGTVHIFTGATEFGQDINSSNDVLAEGGASKPILFHSTCGALDLSKIVVASNSTQQTFWTGAGASWSLLTERGIPGTDPSVADFPAIVGSVASSTLITDQYFWAYVLLPIPVQE